MRHAITQALSGLWLDGFGASEQVVQFSPRYRLAFSLMNENIVTGGSPLGWDVRSAIKSEFLSSLRSQYSLA